MATSKPILYSYWRSSCAWRVRIALNLKKIAYDYQIVDIVKGKHRESDFTKLNPGAKVPVFIDGDVVLGESLAIIEYLDETRSTGQRLLPTDPVQRAKARAIALHIACNIQPLQNPFACKFINERAKGVGTEFAVHSLSNGLKQLEELVKSTAGRYLVGDELSIADICLPSILYNARRNNVDLTGFPTLLRLDEELAKIPEFADAQPDKQPDANLNA